MKRILKFHEGRGGRFFNPGYLTFESFDECIQDDNTIADSCFVEEETGRLLSASGNELDYQFNEDGTGYINYDNNYDTIYYVMEDDLTVGQQTCLSKIDVNDVYYDEVRTILEKYYDGY